MSEESLGEAFPKEQARCRELLGQYKAIGPNGAFGVVVIEQMLQRADQAMASGDVIEMLRVYKEMQESK